MSEVSSKLDALAYVFAPLLLEGLFADRSRITTSASHPINAVTSIATGLPS